MAPQARDQRGVALAGGAEFDAAGVGTCVADSYRKEIQVFCLAQALKPFDRGDAGGKQVFAQSQILEASRIEAIEVDVEERQTSMVFLNKRKARAQDVLFAKSETAGQALDEAGLAGTQVADQPEQLSALEQRCEPPSPCLRLVGRPTFDYENCRSGDAGFAWCGAHGNILYPRFARLSSAQRFHRGGEFLNEIARQIPHPSPTGSDPICRVAVQENA